MTVMPVGSIVAFAGTAAPKGWLMCTGDVIPAGREFDSLRKLVGANTPDLQGYFLRGIDPKGKVDPQENRKIFSIQSDGVGPHSHTYNRWFHAVAGKSGGDPVDVAANSDSPETSGPNPNSGETRPKNRAVNFIIKATEEG